MSEALKMIVSLSLSGSLLILILLAGRHFWKNKVSKRWQYYIWLVVIARLLLPFGARINLAAELPGLGGRMPFRLSGAPLAGERVKITIREEGELYDTLIPAAALCKDATGYYVLVMRENDSVLGEGYKAHRMSVDLLDSDEACCAVRGLPADELVIIASIGEIADGSNVFYEGDGTQ